MFPARAEQAVFFLVFGAGRLHDLCQVQLTHHAVYQYQTFSVINHFISVTVLPKPNCYSTNFYSVINNVVHFKSILTHYFAVLFCFEHIY